MDRVITASQFQAARGRARLTNRELAKLLSVSPSTISNWLRDGVVGHAEAAVEDKLGMYLRDDSPNRPLSAYSDVELLAEIWQRMDGYKRLAAGDPTPKDEVVSEFGPEPSEVHARTVRGSTVPPTPSGGAVRGRAGKPPRTAE